MTTIIPYAFSVYQFQDLNSSQLYDILNIRNTVLVAEQASPYLDTDYCDQNAVHLLVTDGDALIAYARVFNNGKYTSFGRLVVLPDYRGKSLGRYLTEECLTLCQTLYPNTLIHIEAQSYLRPFYEGFGFHTVSEPYDWDGIEHVNMEKKA